MRVVVVDDHELMRRGLTMLLGTSPLVEVVGEAAEGREALAVVERAGPDVVLSDARMPGMDGVALVAALAERHPGLPVIILTTFDDEPIVRAAVTAGASGFLLKDTSTDRLVQAMRAVLDGGLVIDHRVARMVLGGAGGEPPPGGTGRGSSPAREGPLAVLTRAELAVAALVATGATNSEIANHLVIAEGTVKNHVSTLLRKLGRRDRTALALYLHRYLPGAVEKPRGSAFRF